MNVNQPTYRIKRLFYSTVTQKILRLHSSVFMVISVKYYVFNSFKLCMLIALDLKSLKTLLNFGPNRLKTVDLMNISKLCNIFYACTIVLIMSENHAWNQCLIKIKYELKNKVTPAVKTKASCLRKMSTFSRF